jgi:hypothetical protein
MRETHLAILAQILLKKHEEELKVWLMWRSAQPKRNNGVKNKQITL